MIAGASGLVGAELLRQLLAAPDYTRVISLGRRSLAVSHEKLEQITTTFTSLDVLGADARFDDAFCCLGTTQRKAGSRENFRAVDQTAVLAFAWAARRHGARRFFLVSALGANPGSRVFYSRVKGETEEALTVLGFESLVIFQPSLLLGVRAERRLGERFGAAALWLAEPFLRGQWRKYRAIEGAVVARAMVRRATGPDPRGVQIIPSDEIQELGGFGVTM